MGEHATVKWLTQSALRKLSYEVASEPWNFVQKQICKSDAAAQPLADIRASGSSLKKVILMYHG